MKLKNNRIVDDLYNSKNYPRLYRIWTNARYRCSNPNANNYKYYGGKGITFCEEWNKFASFCKWSLNNGYEDDLTLDRVDVNKGYEPNNCRWVTMKDQTNNKRNNVYYEYDGQLHTLSQWSEIYGLNYDTVLTRYSNGKRGDDLFKPTRTKKNDSRFENIKYSDATLMGWSKKKLISYIKNLYEIAQQLKAGGIDGNERTDT